MLLGFDYSLNTPLRGIASPATSCSVGNAEQIADRLFQRRGLRGYIVHSKHSSSSPEELRSFSCSDRTPSICFCRACPAGRTFGLFFFARRSSSRFPTPKLSGRRSLAGTNSLSQPQTCRHFGTSTNFYQKLNGPPQPKCLAYLFHQQGLTHHKDFP